mgnify:CR=1 FL=1
MGGGRGKLAIVGSVEFHSWPTVRLHTPCPSCRPCIPFPGQHFPSAAHPLVEISRPAISQGPGRQARTNHPLDIHSLKRNMFVGSTERKKILPSGAQQTVPVSSEWKTIVLQIAGGLPVAIGGEGANSSPTDCREVPE